MKEVKAYLSDKKGDNSDYDRMKKHALTEIKEMTGPFILMGINPQEETYHVSSVVGMVGNGKEIMTFLGELELQREQMMRTLASLLPEDMQRGMLDNIDEIFGEKNMLANMVRGKEVEE